MRFLRVMARGKANKMQLNYVSLKSRPSWCTTQMNQGTRALSRCLRGRLQLISTATWRTVTSWTRCAAQTSRLGRCFKFKNVSDSMVSNCNTWSTCRLRSFTASRGPTSAQRSKICYQAYRKLTQSSRRWSWSFSCWCSTNRQLTSLIMTLTFILTVTRSSALIDFSSWYRYSIAAPSPRRATRTTQVIWDV